MGPEDLHALGQSVWLDHIRRHLLRSGQLAALIRDGHSFRDTDVYVVPVLTYTPG
jgi:hypothetical protein